MDKDNNRFYREPQGLPKEISEFMERYGVLADEVWSVRSGAFAVKHKAIERVAAAAGIEIENLQIYHFSPADKTAAVIVTARMRLNEQVTEVSPGGNMAYVTPQRERRVTTTGEAAPTNNKNSYPLAMAEKRAVDRAVLKLLNTHGALYSDVEADEFGDPDSGEKGTLLKSSQYARGEYQKLLTAIRNCSTHEMLDEFSKAYKEQVRAQPEEWKAELRREWQERADELK